MPGMRCGIERASAVMTLAVGAMMTAVLMMAALTHDASPVCAGAKPAHETRSC